MTHKEDKRELIKDKSLILFSERGFEATSIRQIAQASNINIAMISYYFGSKEHLLEEIIKDKLGVIKLYEKDIIFNNNNSEQNLEIFIKNLIEKFIQNTAFYNLLHSELVIKQRVFSGETYYTVKQHNEAILQKIIASGIAEGLFRLTPTISVIQAFIIGPYINFILNRRYYSNIAEPGTDDSFDRYIRDVLVPNIIKSTISLLK
ncbi:MAG: TetR/AcrR family transcriptional regulator [Flavipsychrobacter sp.]|nr:TetR/AcrR family transcriptional regulator [Flavipsychrobacter sp.]